MTEGRYARFETLLRGLERQNRARSLQRAEGVDFSSNDYLALAGSARLARAVQDAIARGVPVGSAGSRLLRGHHPEHEALEAEAASFFKADRCLYFGSGFAANVAIFSSLPGRGDLVVHDQLVHASTLDGIRAGRADAVSTPHNDPDAVRDAIRAWRMRGGRGTPWIAVESLYSMDGDFAPLSALVQVAEEHDAFLIVDEAHATGVFGANGAGLTAPWAGHDALITLHTAGKALGASGALVGADRRLIETLINRARNFIFATAPSPLMAAAVRNGLRCIQDEPERQESLKRLVSHARSSLGNFCGGQPDSQIIPIILGSCQRAMQAARLLQQAGFDCRAVRPPTVAEGKARLRVSINLNVSDAQITLFADAVQQCIRQ